jgi:hypothetical protein
MLLNNFTLYIGPKKRWIEVRPLYIFEKGKWPALTGEYVIYSNATRNTIGELPPEANQNASILGSFFYSPDANSAHFKGKETLDSNELSDLLCSVKAMIVINYAQNFGITVSL